MEAQWLARDGEGDSEFCLDLYRKGRRRREVFQLNADYIALSRYWKYIDTPPLRPPRRAIPVQRVRKRRATPASHIIGRARVESFSPTRIIETSVNNDSAISRCITKQTREAGLPLAFPPFFFPSTSFSLRRLFKPSAGGCRLARRPDSTWNDCTRKRMWKFQAGLHTCTHHPRYSMFAQVQPKRPTLCQPWIRLNIVPSPPPSIQEIFNLSSRFIITHIPISNRVHHDAILRNTCNRERRGRGGGEYYYGQFLFFHAIHHTVSFRWKEGDNGETMQFEFDIGDTRLVWLG